MLDRAFRGSDAVAAGLVTWHQLRGPGYVRYFPDVYLAAGAPATLRMRSLAAYELVARRAAEPGARGCRRLDEIVELADPAAESPMETRLRLVLVRAGLPRPVLQYRLRNEYGVVVARFDLAYPKQRLAVEYDGRHHQWRALSADDRFRDGETGNLGWHTMRFTYDDVMLTRRRTAELVANQLRRRSPGSTPRR